MTKSRHRSFAHPLTPGARVVLSAALFTLVLVLFTSAGAPQNRFVSSEVKFTDNSRSGLAIVPASCPSDPHSAGECDPATCSVWIDQSAIYQGSGATVYWSSTNATSFWISDIGWVAASGGTAVYPSQTTAYVGTVTGTYGDSSCGATLTVYRYCPFNGENITHGNSVTAYQAASVLYGSSCVSETRTCSDSTLSGSYAHSSCSVGAPANCSLNGTTVLHGASQTFYTTQVAPSGQLCSSLYQSRTCTNGSLSGSNTYQYASCSCIPTYSCSGQTIQYTNASCSVSNVTTCASPGFCSAGSSICLYPVPAFTSSGNHTGHLEVSPQIVRQGVTTKVFWDVENVSTCTVSGSNGDSWSGASAGCDGAGCSPGSSGKTSGAINQQTIYTLSCTPLNPSATFTSERATVNIIPVFEEL